LVRGEVLTLMKLNIDAPTARTRPTSTRSSACRFTSRDTRVPSESLDWIEKKKFENLVHLYTDELYKIQSDMVIGGVLDQRETTRLLREGVLIIEEHGRMGRQTIYRLSEETLDILNRLFTSMQ
jgi:hypothetical protein